MSIKKRDPNHPVEKAIASFPRNSGMTDDQIRQLMEHNWSLSRDGKAEAAAKTKSAGIKIASNLVGLAKAGGVIRGIEDHFAPNSVLDLTEGGRKDFALTHALQGLGYGGLTGALGGAGIGALIQKLRGKKLLPGALIGGGIGGGLGGLAGAGTFGALAIGQTEPRTAFRHYVEGRMSRGFGAE